MKSLSANIFFILLAICAIFLVSCSSDDPTPRSENDICGTWMTSEGNYMYFKLPNICYKLIPESEEFATLDYDAYYYEPGYNILLYVNIESQPDIYQVTSLTDTEMIWVWADNLLDDKYDGMSKSEILGAVIKQAQEGFHLDYSRTITFTRISTAEFNSQLEKYDFPFDLDEL